jgi:putative ABC transport system permease protein
MIALHRWFSAAVIATLALGIGINTTVFTLVNAVLYRPVPIPGGERLVAIKGQESERPQETQSVSWADYLEFKAAKRSFQGIEALQSEEGVISEAGNPPERFSLARVTAGLFPLFQMAPTLGRGIMSADCAPGAASVILLGNNVWKNRYAGAPGVIGRMVRVNGLPAMIVGVMPEGFKFPNHEEFWMPLVPNEALLKRTNHNLELFGLLNPGVSPEGGTVELQTIAARIAADHPDTDRNLGAVARTFHMTYNGGRIRLIFLMMLGAVGFLLLITCANVANMMLGRSLTRARELAVRAAIGASRWQLMRQMLVECVVLGVLGGAAGLGLAMLGVHAFDLATRDVGKPYWIQFTMDGTAFTYIAAISVLSGIVFGLFPALASSRVDLNAAMKNGSPGAGSHKGRLAAALVVFQFALTVVLLAGAGLMVRSFFAAQELNSFVHAESLLTARIELPTDAGDRYESADAKRRFFGTLLPKLAALPGVTSVAATNEFPGMGNSARTIEVEDHPLADLKKAPLIGLIVETPNYLSVIGVPLLQGRGLTEQDGDTGRESAVASRSFANEFWPGNEVIGKRFRFIEDGKAGAWTTVVGLCPDYVQDPNDPSPLTVVHISYRQQPWSWMGLMLRTRSDPEALASSLRAAAQEIDQDLPVYETRTLTAAVNKQMWFLNVFGSLFAVFALTGLLMASVGIYATVAQRTARRTREIGIRMALGSTTAGILRLVLSRGLVQLGLGLVLGLAGAFAATSLLGGSGLLVGTSVHDPVVFSAVVALLFAIGLAACWMPARRASRITPVEALRTE